MKITRRQMLILLPAAAVAWDAVLAGTPEASPNYNLTEHWWGMLVDISKCIGCGNCVRACAAENDVPEGYFRTWVERYHVSDDDLADPVVDSPDGGKNGFPPILEPGGKTFFVPKMCNHCADSPCTQVCPVGATFMHPGWRRARGQELLHRLPVLHPGLPLRLPLPESQDSNGGEVHALLSPHHQGPHHRLL
jgi:tetrathionate reductase subunit B